MTDDTPATSADRDAWLELARAMRAAVADRVPQMAEMAPAELVQFVDAARAVMQLDADARTFDMRSAAARFVQSGFSQRTCLPAPAAATVDSQCRSLGRPSTTRSRSGSSNILR
jgi:hypothetical protein